MPAPFEFGKQVGNDPMAAVNAKRVADMKSMAAKVRGASGTPNPTGDGTHRWSGRVMPGGSVQGAQYTPPSTPLVKQPQQSAPLQKAPPSRPAARSAPMSMLSSMPMQPKVTSTPVDNAELRKQIQQAQQVQQPPASPPPPPAGNQPAPAAPTLMDRARGAWNAFQNPAPSSTPGVMSAPMSGVSTAFNNATGQQDPPHIITTDNGRKFNTQTKTFLDGRPGGFAR